MLPTKVEIKLRKSNGAHWSNLDFPRTKQTLQSEQVEQEEEEDSTLEDQVDAVDLSDLWAHKELCKKFKFIFWVARVKRVTIGAHLKTAQQILNGIVFDDCENMSV